MNQDIAKQLQGNLAELQKLYTNPSQIPHSVEGIKQVGDLEKALGENMQNLGAPIQPPVQKMMIGGTAKLYEHLWEGLCHNLSAAKILLPKVSHYRNLVKELQINP
jgi:hypothetical protein